MTTGFARVSKELIACFGRSGIPARAFLVFVALLAHRNMNVKHKRCGKAWPSVAELMELTGRSRRSILDDVTLLKEAGFLSVQRTRGVPIYSFPDPPKAPRRGARGCTPSHKEEVQRAARRGARIGKKGCKDLHEGVQGAAPGRDVEEKKKRRRRDNPAARVASPSKGGSARGSKKKKNRRRESPRSTPAGSETPGPAPDGQGMLTEMNQQGIEQMLAAVGKKIPSPDNGGAPREPSEFAARCLEAIGPAPPREAGKEARRGWLRKQATWLDENQGAA